MSKYLLAALVLAFGATSTTYGVEINVGGGVNVGGGHVGAGVNIGGGHRDGYTFREGHVHSYRQGTPTVINSEVTFHNGSRILPDGYIVYRDGRRERIAEGRWVSTEGEWVPVDTVPAAATADATFEGYFWRDGKVYLRRGTTETIVTTEVTLTNGARILPDGFIVFRDGRRERFDDRRITVAGEWFGGQNSAAVAVDANFEGYFWRDNRVYMRRGGTETVLTTEVTLADGSRLSPEGFIVGRDGNRTRFSADLRFTLDGKRVSGHGDYRSPEDTHSRDTTGARVDANATNRTDVNRTNRTDTNTTNRTDVNTTNRTDANTTNRTDANTTNRTDVNATNRTDANTTQRNNDNTRPGNSANTPAADRGNNANTPAADRPSNDNTRPGNSANTPAADRSNNANTPAADRPSTDTTRPGNSANTPAADRSNNANTPAANRPNNDNTRPGNSANTPAADRGNNTQPNTSTTTPSTR